MKKLALLLIAIFALAPFFPARVDGAVDINAMSAKSAILMDAKSGEILFEKNAHEKREPASVTKVMTLLLAMEAIDNGELSYDSSVTVSQEAAKTGGTQLYLETGEIRTVDELLYGICVESANDAANAIASHLGGTIPGFIEMMNARAKELGCNDTHFNSACGLHEEDHYTSAYDLAIISRELIKHEEILKYTDTWMTDVYVGKANNVKRTLANTNKLISRLDYIDGLKTGYTKEAGHCISLTGKIGDMRLIGVIMGSSDSETRFSEATALLDYGFSQYKANFPVKAGNPVTQARVFNAKNEFVNITVADDVYQLTKVNEDRDYTVESEIDVSSLSAPMKKGDVVGKIIVKVDGEVIDTVDAVAAEDASKCSFFEFLGRVFPQFF